MADANNLVQITSIVKGRLKNKSDSAAEWNRVNPILLEGEIGYVTDNGRFKIGNGRYTWRSLPYAGETDLSQLFQMLEDNDQIIAQLTDRVNALPEMVEMEFLNETAAFDYSLSNPNLLIFATFTEGAGS